MAASLALELTDRERPFQGYLAKARSDINDHIRHLLKDRNMPHGLEVHIMGGKRLRGGLTLLLHDVLGGRDRAAALDLAASVEVAHSIGLMIDDVLDGDVERRGEAAVHVDMGIGRAMLEALGLMSVPYALAAEHGREAVESLARVHRSLVSGARIEISTSDTSWELYHSIIAQKTGGLFALSTAYGAMAADAGQEVVEAAREYGMRCGIAYQVIDDILDMDHANEAGGCSGPMLARLLRAEGHGPDAGVDRLYHRCVVEAQEAGEAISALASPTDPFLLSCLTGAPTEMARMMLK
jgi:geranylgeranyl pyrophosphate synthase